MYIEKLHVVYFHLFGGDVFLTFLYMCDRHIRSEIHASRITLPFLTWQYENIVKTKYYVL